MKIGDEDYIFEDYDIKVVDFHIEDYKAGWFDIDAFHRDKFFIEFEYHSDNFDDTGKSADIKARKTPHEDFNLSNKEYFDWFAVEVDNNVCRDYYFAKNKKVEDFLIKLWHQDEENIYGFYMCQFGVKNYRTLQYIFDKVSELSENEKISRLFWFEKTYINDFVNITANLKEIPVELKNYFETSFASDFEAVKSLDDKKSGDTYTFYRSGILFKNNGKDFMYFSKNENNISLNFFDKERV